METPETKCPTFEDATKAVDRIFSQTGGAAPQANELKAVQVVGSRLVTPDKKIAFRLSKMKDGGVRLSTAAQVGQEWAPWQHFPLTPDGEGVVEFSQQFALVRDYLLVSGYEVPR